MSNVSDCCGAGIEQIGYHGTDICSQCKKICGIDVLPHKRGCRCYNCKVDRGEIYNEKAPPVVGDLREKIAKIYVGKSERIGKIVADRILSIIKEVGYVKLDKDQIVPEMCTDVPEDKDSLWWKQAGYLESQMDMINAGWRKTE